ncbi:MAG: hypothetical protein JST82_04365 [Bacteroidetes bacterium]|nr:hypothetical protein [Bacteroidota bacterium]
MSIQVIFSSCDSNTMNDKLYINNRTDKPLIATISDNYTGTNIISCPLLPGANEVVMKDLEHGIYTIFIEDENHDIYYRQTINK